MRRSLFTNQWKKTAAAFTAAALLITTSPFSGSSYAAGIPKLDQIRVALFLDGKAGGGIPYVTLSSQQALAIGVRTPAGIQPWIDTNPGASVRFSLDQFAVLVFESSDYAQARLAADKLPAEADHKAVVWTRSKQGKTVYQVTFGTFGDITAAAAMRDQLSGNPSLAGVIKAGALPIVGPKRLNAGTYADEASAAKQQAAAAQAGFIADVVLQADAAGKASYHVWIGSEASEEGLSALQKQAMAAMPGTQLQPVTETTPYLLRRAEATSAAAADTHYVIGGAGTKLWVQPKQSQGITVKERFGRNYRGAVELSQQGDSLAVINEVPFDSYVASVVGTEMGTGWPLEALKAQAVTARTFALKQGMKYQVANVTDSTMDQAYKGISSEAEDVVAAAAATQGEVLVDGKGVAITPFYSSNAGGLTADATEAWGNSVSYLKSVASVDDGAAASKKMWYHIALGDGSMGYVRSDYLKNTGSKNGIGLPIYSATETGVNVRPAPSTDASSAPTDKLNGGDRVTVIGEVKESNAYSWQRGPIDAAALQSQLGTYGLNGALSTLEVSRRGPSGRAIELKANGQALKLPNPDSIRTALRGLPSTRFEIEETGRYTILGANGATRELPEAAGPLYALSAGASSSAPMGENMVVMSGDGSVRILSSKPKYVITGTGYGHGVGMSQWGARGYAELGYDYKKILQTYYSGVSIVKDGS